MLKMRTALIVGNYTPGDAFVELFQKRTRKLGYTPVQADYKAGCSHLPGQREDHLVLFCVPFGLAAPSELLKSLRPCGKRTIAYVHTDMASTDEAIRYSDAGWADGYVVGGDGASDEESLRSFDDLVWKLHSGKPPYGRIDFDWDKTGEQIAFVSTAFDYNNRLVMERAVNPALERLGFKVDWADSDYREGLHNAIRKKINRCTLLIANVSLDQRYMVHNPNVYFEAGIAASKNPGKVIFVRRNGENGIDLPADIHGRRPLSYRDEIHLALLLYHGLKPHAS